MLRAKAIVTLFSSTLVLAACGQLIGLGEYTEVEGDAAGKGGKGGSAGKGGSSGKGGTAGEAGQSGGGTTGGSTSGRGGEAGADAGSGGIGGAGDGGGGNSAGDAGEGGVNAGGAGGSAGAGTGGTTAVGGAGAGGEGGGPRVCTEITLVDLLIGGETKGEEGQYYYYADFEPQLGGVSADYLTLQFFHGNGYDGAQNGTFDLGTGEDNQYATCSRCVVLYEDDSTGGRLYFQESGTLYLPPESDQMSGYPLAELSDVTLVEVTFDEDFVSTPVDGGACVHLAQGTIAATPEEPAWNYDTCSLSWRTDGICDCGCGGRDPDCPASTSDVCEGCYCEGETECNPTSNWLCDPVTPPPPDEQ